MSESVCPICGMGGGFHDRPHFDVPLEYFKEKGWYEQPEQEELAAKKDE